MAFSFSKGHIFFLWLNFRLLSSLHWDISLPFFSFSNNGVYYNVIELSVSDIIVSEKGANGDRKYFRKCMC